MEIQNNIYRPSLRAVDVKEARRYAGLRQSQDFPNKIVQDACNIVMLEMEPRAVWVAYPYEAESGTILSEKPYVIPSNNLRRHLGKSEQVILLSATAGERVEEVATKAFADDEYALGLLIDAAATTVVEQIADELEKLILAKYQGQGFRLLTRFSPGYGDWDLKEQVAVAQLANAEAIGVTLTDSLMLMPRKSITAIIGLTTEKKPGTFVKGCQSCSMTDCTLRKGGEK